MNIGILRETKSPIDNRTPFIPSHCNYLIEKLNYKITVQPSPIRCYSDNDYLEAGCELLDDVSNCDIVFGIKEVKIDCLLPGLTYFIFSHTKKKQSHNRPLLQAILEKNITLCDYECLIGNDNKRLLGFGNWAGIVGAHNGLLEYGKRTGKYKLQAAHRLLDYNALKLEYKDIQLPKLKIAVTGSGRVADGALELLQYLKIKQLSIEQYANQTFNEPVFVHLYGETLYINKNDKTYDRGAFHAKPEDYTSTFKQVMPHTDLLINGVYWDTKIPRLFELNEVKSKDWRMYTIADISCDEGGSVPITLISTTIDKPTFGYDIDKKIVCQPYQKNTIDIMAVDNLPNELPRDASGFFGDRLIEFVLPQLLDPTSTIIYNATIAKGGELNIPFLYLSDYVLENAII